MRTSPWVDAVLFALGFALSGLVLLALVWSGTGPYEDMARANGVSGTAMILSVPPGEDRVDLATLREWHEGWSSYVTGARAEAPRFAGQPFTEDEYAHMADVRRVFDGAKVLVPAGLLVMGFRLQRARLRGLDSMLRVARDGALGALIIVVVIGVVAVVAFDQLFLMFHYVVFPQGNFLFDPRTTNLVRLYPDWYWEGVTLRIGLCFVALAAAISAASALALRRVQASRLATE